MLTVRVVSLGNEQAWGTEGNKIEGMPIQECIIKLAVFERGPMVLSHSRIFYRMVKNEPHSCLLKEWKEEPFINWLSTPITWVLPGGILTPLHFWVSCAWLPRELLHASQAEASEIDHKTLVRVQYQTIETTLSNSSIHLLPGILLIG